MSQEDKPTDKPADQTVIASNAWPALATVLDASALSTVACTFVTAIANQPDLPERLARMGLIFKTRKQKRDARLLAAAAKTLAPEDFKVRLFTEWLARHEAPLWHFPMVHDALRNETYASALAHHVKPGMCVFEIGTGTGLLAMLAVRAGAGHVYTCERSSEIAEVAREIVARNGMSDRITVIAKEAKDLQLGVDLPGRADLFVAEIVDNGLLGEEVLPLTEFARTRLLKPEAILLPGHISTVGFLVSGAGQQMHYRMESAMGFDLSAFNRFSPLELDAGQGGGDVVEPLSAATELIHFDLHQDVGSAPSRQVRLVADREGLAEGLMRWLRLDFGAGIVFENRPPQRSSWFPQLHILPTPHPVHPGDVLDFEVMHEGNRLFVIPQPS